MLKALTKTVSKGLLPSFVVDTLDITVCNVFLTVVVPPTGRGGTMLTIIITTVLVDALFGIVPFLSRISSNFIVVVAALVITKTTTCFYPVRSRGRRRNIRRSWCLCLRSNGNDDCVSSPCTPTYSFRGESRGSICRVVSMLYSLHVSNDRSVSNSPFYRERYSLNYYKVCYNASYNVWKRGSSCDYIVHVYYNVCYKGGAKVYDMGISGGQVRGRD